MTPTQFAPRKPLVVAGVANPERLLRAAQPVGEGAE
jgi:hypothetical protein